MFPSDVEYAEWGEGPALLFVPGSFGTGAGWKPVMERLGPQYRYITTSLLGYGATKERRPLGNETMSQQVEALDLILDRIDAPTHIVAHSFGGLSAVAHAITGVQKPASLTLVEANPLGILKTAGDSSLYGMFAPMTDRYFAEFANGVPDAARHVIDFYAGEGSFEALPQKVRDYIIETTPSNIRDWTSGTAFAPPLGAYAQIDCPTLVVRGGQGHPAMLRIAELLTEHIPDAHLVTIEGGSHFLPASHPRDLADAIASHLAQSGAV